MADSAMVDSASESKSQPDGGDDNRTAGAGAITPELVREVTEKVYALLLADLRMARERRGSAASRTRPGPGGR